MHITAVILMALALATAGASAETAKPGETPRSCVVDCDRSIIECYYHDFDYRNHLRVCMQVNQFCYDRCNRLFPGQTRDIVGRKRVR